jgi:hypothetical protein
MADSVTLRQLSPFDDWDYHQALVLHEVFDDSRVSPRMEAVLERMRTTKGRRSHRDAAWSEDVLVVPAPMFEPRG